MTRYIFTLLLFIAFAASTTYGQDIAYNNDTITDASVASSSSRSDALNVFLDCDRCDHRFIKESISFVNYVNNRDEADVFVMMTRRNTGSGGAEHIISFTGLKNYEGMTDTLTYFTTPNSSRDETRRGQVNILALGLMRFVALTPLSQNIDISYREPEGRGMGRGRSMGSGGVVEDDPWNSWVFRLSTRGNYSKDENYEDISLNSSVSADRVTPEWKSEFDARYNFDQRNVTTDSAILRFPRRSWNISTQQVKSVGPHLSVGGNIRTSSSTYGNTKFAFEVHPAIEYNIYPYSESFKRQIRIQYTVQFNYVDYMDTTLFDEVKEMIYRHQLALSAGFNQPWGSGNFSIRGGHHFDDANFWSFRLHGRIDWRVYKGLSINVNANAAIIRDDKAIPKKEASLEDALMKIQKLNSEYSYSIGFGLSYSFGSIYNNVVNTRF